MCHARCIRRRGIGILQRKLVFRMASKMTLRESDLIRVEAVNQANDKPPRIFLRYASNYRLEVTGAILERQFTDGGRHILFVTEDIPFEETLHIYLVNSNLEPIDHLSLSAIYSPGILKNISITAPNEISFSFFDAQETWRLTVTEKPIILLWGNTRLIRRTGPLLHKTWLSLKKIQPH